MSKSNYFSGKSVFGQLISLIDDKIIKGALKNVVRTGMLSVLQPKTT
ncbi:hypothetical protein AAKU52_003332 [Pedobacter sp. CG_S7]